MAKEVKNYKLKALPTKPIPDAILYIKADGDSAISTYITDINGIPYPLKDDASSGGVQSVFNIDGTISVIGTTDVKVSIQSSILSTINSALQPGDLPNTKAEFNSQLSDGDFLFVGDVIPYTDEEAQNAVGNIFIDSNTIDITYDDLTPSISAIVKPNSITPTELADNINLTEFVNNAGFENTSQLNTRDTNNRNRANHTGTQAISTVVNLQSSLDSKLDKGGYIGTAQTLSDAIDAIFVPDQLISAIAPTRSVNTFTYPALGYTALINKTLRTNPAQFVTTITATSTTNHKRVDLIYFKSNNTLDKLIGTEDLISAPRPDVPAGSVGVSFINVFGNVIETPTPITNEISIQDTLGVEKFTITDYIRFRGVGFDLSTKQINIESLVPFTVFIDTVNGDDFTGQIENKSRPFKTDSAAYNSLPTDDGTDWTISYIDLNVTRQMSVIPNRNIIIECNNTGIFDFSGISSGFISSMSSDKKFTFNAPNCEFRFINNALSSAVYFTSGILELNINCTLLNIQANGVFDGNFFVSSKTSIEISTIRMNYVAKLFCPLNSSSVLDANIDRLEIFKGTLSLFYNNYIVINTLYSTITGRSLIYNQFSPSMFDITVRGIDQNSSGELYFVSGVGTGVLKLYDFKIPNLLDLICTGKNFYTEGNLTTDSKPITIIDGACNFKLRNFSGKLPLLQFSVDTSVVWVLENSVINVPATFIDAQNIPNKGDIDFKIFNSVITQDTPSQIFKNVNSTGNNFKITQTGSFATNATSIGRNVSLIFSSLTFKEKKNEIIVRDKIDIINKVLSSSIKYIIDGDLVLVSGEYIQVPITGLDLGGYGFDTSSISKNISGQSIFISPAGNSGNFVTKDISYFPGQGTVFNLVDSNGTHAIELNDVNFQGVSGSSLGTLSGYRQFTGTTCGFYGLSDGMTLEGNWSGFKLTNSNIIGFGSSGTLFKKGTSTLFSNRFYIDLNIQISTGSVICDFLDINFTNDKSLQVVNCYTKVNGIINDATTSITFPNITPYSSKSYFVNNIGIKNSNNMPYGISTANMQTYANDTDAASGGIVAVGDTYIETLTGYFKKRLT